jgi:hypothetical protein
MTYRPKIAARMANGDDHTAAWLQGATFHKITQGESKGAWIAWKPGKMAYLDADHPAGLGCNWLDGPGIPTLDAAIALAESETL